MASKYVLKGHISPLEKFVFSPIVLLLTSSLIIVIFLRVDGHPYALAQNNKYRKYNIFMLVRKILYLYLYFWIVHGFQLCAERAPTPYKTHRQLIKL